jgi:Rad3-related DNA helicase
VSLRPLRPHQERAIAELHRSLSSGRKRPMLQAPTGFEKTLLAAHVVASALGKGRRGAFVVPRKTLIDQDVLIQVRPIATPAPCVIDPPTRGASFSDGCSTAPRSC